MPGPSKVSFALLGCGRIGKMHAGVICRNESATLSVVFDPSPEAAQAVADRTGARIEPSAHDAINSADVDAVLIASATSEHCGQVVMCADAGKPALCEKPLGLKLDLAYKCGEFLLRNPVPVQVGFNQRFDSGHAAARRAMIDGEIGRLHQVAITSRSCGHPPRGYHESCGGFLVDMVAHDFDMTRHLLGEDPISVFAVLGRLLDPEALVEIDDFDAATAVLLCESGPVTVIDACRSSAYGYDQRIELNGSEGMLVSGNRRPHELEMHTARHTSAKARLHESFVDRYRESYEIQLREFVAAVRGNGETPTTFDDGVRAMEIAAAAYSSVMSGKMEAVPELGKTEILPAQHALPGI